MPGHTGSNLVIHVVTSLDYGGVERHMELIAGALDNAKMRHMFVAIGRGGAAEEKLKELGVDVLCLGERTAIPSISAIKSLFKTFRFNRPLVVHSHGAEANFHGLLAAWLARVPVRIGEEIGIPGHSSKAKAVFRLVYRFAHRVIGISQAVTDWLVNSHEVPPSKAIRIYNPVILPDLVQTSPGHVGVFRIGFVGRLEPVKNPCALLDAVGLLIARGIPCELWIVGDGSERAALEQSISIAGLEGKVRLWGYQSAPTLLLSQCDIYVQPSISEGFGIALVEAMGCEVPVIATAVGGAPEIIEQGETGWLLHQATPALIAEALTTAWEVGPEIRRAMGIRARASVLGRFEPVSYVEQIEQMYQGLIG